jgi:hypothetical protein
MPKVLGLSITCAAASADICRTGQINTQDIWRFAKRGVWSVLLYLYETAATRLKIQARQRLGDILVTRLMRMRQINPRGLRHTLR